MILVLASCLHCGPISIWKQQQLAAVFTLGLGKEILKDLKRRQGLEGKKRSWTGGGGVFYRIMKARDRQICTKGKDRCWKEKLPWTWYLTLKHGISVSHFQVNFNLWKFRLWKVLFSFNQRRSESVLQSQIQRIKHSPRAWIQMVIWRRKLISVPLT